MSDRSPVGVFLFSFFLFFFYPIYWLVQTKTEMKNLGCEIPSAWLIIVPFANLYWEWKYCQGVQSVTHGRISALLCFFILTLRIAVGVVLNVIAFTNHDKTPYFTSDRFYITAAIGALSLAIIQAIFNSTAKSEQDTNAIEAF